MRVTRPHMYTPPYAPWIGVLFKKTLHPLVLKFIIWYASIILSIQSHQSLSNITKHTLHLCFVNINGLPSPTLCVHNIDNASFTHLIRVISVIYNDNLIYRVSRDLVKVWVSLTTYMISNHLRRQSCSFGCSLAEIAKMVR